MSRPLRAAVCLFLSLAALAGAQPPMKDPPPAEVKLPADSILVLYAKIEDALRALPRYYLLTPKDYNALMAEIDRLNKQLQARQPAAVSAWHITGKVKNGIAELKATFHFVTDRDKASVSLACRGAQPTAVTLDDKVPPLSLGADGLTVEVEEKGAHKAVVDMLLPLREITASGAPRPAPMSDPMQGFELDLPLSPVTTVDVELPGGVKAPRINDEAINGTMTYAGNKLSGPLGRAAKLKVSWKGSQTLSASQPQLTGRGWVEVRIREGQVVTRAELTVQDLGRAAKDWFLQVPERATVQLKNPADRERLRGDVQGSEAPDGRVTVPLAAPTGEPLTLVVSVQRPRGAGAVGLGPFAVVGAVTQSGVIWIVGEPDQRAQCRPFQTGRGAFTATPRAVEEKGKPEERETPPAGAIAAFNYWAQASAGRGDARDPWFKVEVDAVQGQLDTKVSHRLQLGPGGPGDWRLTSELEVTPIRAEVNQLELDWPAPWLIDRERGPRPPGIVTGFNEDLKNHALTLNLDTEALKPARLTIEAQAGDAAVRAGALGSLPEAPGTSAVLKLPRPRGARDGGGHRIVLAVPDTLDLRLPQPPNPGLELETQERGRIVWRAERFPAQVSVAWKAYRPDVEVKSVVDATLNGDEVKLLHRLELSFEEKDRPDSVLLRVPASVRWLRRVVDGGKKEEDLLPEGPRQLVAGARLVRCPLAAGRGESPGVLLLKYAGPLPTVKAGDSPHDVDVPLVAVAAATHGSVRVRVWADAGTQPRPAPSVSGWDSLALEIVPERDRLPALVLEGQRPWLALGLRLEPSARAGQPTLLLERALLQVRVGDDGFQHHRARFLVRQLSSDHLDLAFPVPLSTMVEPLVTLNGKDVSWKPIDTPAAGDGEDGKKSGPYLARLDLPRQALTRPAALEVSYVLPPGRGGLGAGLQSVLQPVAIPGLAIGVPVRWQVDLPSSWVVLPLDGDASWRWGRRGWLLAPQPAVNNADLERWFWGEGDTRGVLPDDEGSLLPAHVCWRPGLAPLTLYHVPQLAWLLICSLIVLLLGLLLGQLAFSSAKGRGASLLLWVGMVALVLALIAAGLVWPGLVTAFLYGAQPGLAVLLVILLVQWLLHERYRRRVVFLPGFRRVKTGSSVGRPPRAEPVPLPGSNPPEPRPTGPPSSNRGASTGSAPKPQKEPSTVDAPPAGS